MIKLILSPDMTEGFFILHFIVFKVIAKIYLKK